MRYNGKRLSDLTSQDLAKALASLVGTPESIDVDFKRDIPSRQNGKTKDGKDPLHEFLKDVVSFANTVGGVMIFGLDEQNDENGKGTGLAGDICGVELDQVEALCLALSQSLHTGVAPTLDSNVRLEPRSVGDKSVVLCEIAPSMAGPHRVEVNDKTPSFWCRNNHGKYEPDVTELRQLFLQPAAWRTSAEAFRRERLATVKRGWSLSPLALERPHAFVHLLPLGRVDGMRSLRELERELMARMVPYGTTGGNQRWTADGLALICSDTDKPFSIHQYGLALQCGGFEGFTCSFAQGHTLHLDLLVWRTLDFLYEHLPVMREVFAHEPPYWVSVSVHLFAHRVQDQQGTTYGRLHEFFPDEVVAPAIVLYDTDKKSIREQMHPVFDSLWRCVGVGGVPEVVYHDKV